MRSPLRVLDRRKALALIFSAVAAGSAVALAVFEQQSSHRPVAAARPLPPRADPLASEFARCQALGDAGARDPGCLAAWAESRRRFLTPNSRDNGLKPVPQDRPQVGRPEDE